MRYLIEWDGNLYLAELSTALGIQAWCNEKGEIICFHGEEQNSMSLMDLSITLGWLQ